MTPQSDEIVKIPEEYDFTEKVGDFLLTNSLKIMNTKWDFLSSVRFWQLFLIGVSVGLNFPFPNNPWVQGFSAMISVWFGGSVVVKTADRVADKTLEGKKIEAGQSTEDSKVL